MPLTHLTRFFAVTLLALLAAGCAGIRGEPERPSYMEEEADGIDAQNGEPAVLGFNAFYGVNAREEYRRGLISRRARRYTYPDTSHDKITVSKYDLRLQIPRNRSY